MKACIGMEQVESLLKQTSGLCCRHNSYNFCKVKNLPSVGRVTPNKLFTIL